MKWIKRHYILVLVVLFLIAINVLFYFISPETIVERVGVENSYLITFLVAAIGGLSTLTGAVLFGTIATFAAGGSSPFLLGLLGGIGIFISDSFFFYLAQFGRKYVPNNWENWFSRISKFIQSHPRWLILVFIYLYLSLTPLPNDILMIALVLGGYHYRHIWLVLFAGSISIALLTAYIGILWF